MTKQNGVSTIERMEIDTTPPNPLHRLGTVDLNGLERLLLKGVLPSEGSLLTVKVLRDLHDRLDLDQAEIAAHGIPTNGVVQFDQLARVPAKAILFGPVDRDLIIAGLLALDTAKKVGLQHVSLFEKFGVEPVAGE